jgi:hypothetical protein
MRHPILTLSALTLTATAPAPHKVVRSTPALDFSYEWPVQAVAIPPLDLRFYTDAKKALAEAQKNARDDETSATKDNRPFHQHFYSMQWSQAGQSARLLSLQSELGIFEGGAHPNSVHGALLWDRVAKREITTGSLFLRSTAFQALTRSRYCSALNAERRKRRGGENVDMPDFNACPKYSELAIAITDTNGNGRFDAIEFVASPYTAGPYVEGAYEIAVPVTSHLIGAIKPQYRNAFERQRQ